MGSIILTGNGPAGKLHLDHHVGSLKNRIIVQSKGDFNEMHAMIAGAQALANNSNNPDKVRENIIGVVLDYLSCGIDPNKATILAQSHIEQLTGSMFYYTNLVTLSRLEGNPTVRAEIKQEGFGANLPVGFLTYPISRATNITLFNANIVPVGEDQLPMLEQTCEIVRTLNNYYSEVLVELEAVTPDNKICPRLPGLDGEAKMSKSLGNCIYLSGSEKGVKSGVMSMLTDPDHIQISDSGKVEGNTIFTYLDVFCVDDDFSEFLPDYKNLDELKDHYGRGELGDVKIKKFLNNISQKELSPIREKRRRYKQDIPETFGMLLEKSEDTREVGAEALKKVKATVGINYFEGVELISE